MTTKIKITHAGPADRDVFVNGERLEYLQDKVLGVSETATSIEVSDAAAGSPMVTKDPVGDESKQGDG